jgi:hypothetical protein
MKKEKILKNLIRIVVLGFILLTINACTIYKVRVNGYLSEKSTILSGNRVFIDINEQVSNPILSAKIADKIKKILTIKGYIPVEQLSEADYLLLFNYGIGQGNTHAVPHTYSTNSTSYDLNILSGQFEPKTKTKVHSYTTQKTIYNRYLYLMLYSTEGISEKSSPIWIGEVNSMGSSSDLRIVIDYLIVAGFEHFGEDTGKQKKYIFSPTDERTKVLYSSSP